MGGTGSKPVAAEAAITEVPVNNNNNHKNNNVPVLLNASECPMHQNNKNSDKDNKSKTSEESNSGGCPMKDKDGNIKGMQYNTIQYNAI